MAETAPSFEEIAETFELMDDWEERYSYVIELGKALPGLPEERRTPATKVEGCASQVWLWPETRRDDQGAMRLDFEGDSDAHIVRGLIVILKSILAGKTVSEIEAADPAADFARLGLDQQLSSQRSNGLRAMIKRIKEIARNAA